MTCKAGIPGKNPGTSTNVMIGILNASQNLTNLAPFTEAFMSKQPGNQLQKSTYLGDLVASAIRFRTLLTELRCEKQVISLVKERNSSHTCSEFWVIGDDPHSSPLHTCKSDYYIPGVIGHYLEKIALVHYSHYNIQHIVRNCALQWYHCFQAEHVAIPEVSLVIVLSIARIVVLTITYHGSSHDRTGALFRLEEGR